jgi:nucleotide-binding universal stress UspA family protein
MAGSIICGVDDSESAKGAARVARALASKLGLPLVFVRVVERDAPEAEISAVAERLERLSAGANELDCGAAWLVDAGHPADQLVAVAAKSGAALIVVGSSGPRSPRLGSVSAEVSRQAPCPVLVVPPDAAGRPDKPSNGADAPDYAGGIVRFSLGGQHHGISRGTPAEDEGDVSAPAASTAAAGGWSWT